MDRAGSGAPCQQHQQAARTQPPHDTVHRALAKNFEKNIRHGNLLP
jgi:hypothetical protein